MTNTNFDIWSMLSFLPLLILITGCGTNIGGGAALPSNFKWTPPNEADLYTCEISGEHAPVSYTHLTLPTTPYV